MQVCTSDSVFMQRQQLPPRPDGRPASPLDMDTFPARLAAGDEQVRQAFGFGVGWLQEANSGLFRSWDDLAFLSANWDDSIVLRLSMTLTLRWAPTWMASSCCTTVRAHLPERASA